MNAALTAVCSAIDIAGLLLLAGVVVFGSRRSRPDAATAAWQARKAAGEVEDVMSDVPEEALS